MPRISSHHAKQTAPTSSMETLIENDESKPEPEEEESGKATTEAEPDLSSSDIADNNQNLKPYKKPPRKFDWLLEKQPWANWREKAKIGSDLKDDGDCFFRHGDITNALKKYHKAFLYLRGAEVDKSQIYEYNAPIIMHPNGGSTIVKNPELENLRATVSECANNIASCLLIKENPDYDRILIRIDQALKFNSENWKALYNKGFILYQQKNFEGAMWLLKKASRKPESNAEPNVKKYLNLSLEELKGKELSLDKALETLFLPLLK
ncbi:hypothetical protein HELRODRAFT_176363 [Helobdella robusta]|uniref:Rotamase n=1 Tax=Helobdella robusta TaxID=6412 RepID=T1FAG2_HELRO|nr:hypothetical protein HELRODRAFT_176363 [Helobdella robusta]ESO00056.1 hypothetical protein HELRODRAFT_176363 [Helobdella robusta]